MLSPPPDPQSASAAGPRPAAELLIVCNLGSGKDEKGDVRKAIEAELMHAARPYRFVPVEPGQVVQACQQAARLAQEQGGVMVAVGGDGTINAAAQAALGQGCPLGVIAQGTFNLFARELGLPLEVGEATQALLRAVPEPVQVGTVNQRVFLVNASVGLYPKLLADREQAKQRLGRRRWIAVLAGLVSLIEWRLQLRLDADLDGDIRRLRTASLFICNNRVQLERLGIEPEIVAQVGEGRLAGLLTRPLGVLAKLKLIVKAIAGTLGEAHEVDSFTLRSLTVSARSARRLKVATDGEVQWMEQPLRFAVAPRPLLVMLPPPEQRLPRK
ncbi:MAG TPA: diacylglycerol kinase family protein [Ramlibacter sp.]|nr:diacylglycerol kinase family protein [Ramlibacter sp.]